MKNILIILAFIVFSCSQAQQVNYLDDYQYSQIQINNKKLTDIRNTKGSFSGMKSIFGSSFILEEKTEPNLGREIFDNNLSFYFEDNTGLGTNYELLNIAFRTSIPKIRILDKSVGIGDNMNVFGNIKVISDNQGKRALFAHKTKEDGIIFTLNPVNNTITDVQYIFYN
jgi:hypothetical protein